MKRPYEFKLDAYRLYREGNRPIDAFAKAGEIHNVPLSGCMTNPSYASSYMSDDIRGFIRKKAAAHDFETITYFRFHNLDLAHV